MQSLLMPVHFNAPCVLITVAEIQLRGDLKKIRSVSSRKEDSFYKSYLEYICDYYSKPLGERFVKFT